MNTSYKKGLFSSEKAPLPFSKSPNLPLNGNHLKLIACITMVMDHGAKALALRGFWFQLLSNILGRIAFPLFGFLLIEGFFHTHSRLAYARNVLVLALVSEVPFDLVHTGKILEFSHQNTCFTLFLALVLFLLLEKLETLWNGGRLRMQPLLLKWILQVGLTALFLLLACLLRVDYDLYGLGALAVIYFLYYTSYASCALLFNCLILNLNSFCEPAAFLALLPGMLYNGKRGRKKIGPVSVKALFYWFYPLHLLLLYGLSCLL